jgi:hypothetical protein
MAMAACSPPLSPKAKACVASADRYVPGGGNSSTATDLDAAAAAAAMVKAFRDPEDARRRLNAAFTFMGDAPNEQTKRFIAQGNSAAAVDTMIEKLKGWLAGGAEVRVSASAAGQSVTYAFVCGWDNLDVVLAVPKRDAF